MNEIWKDIDGYNGIYQVSNLGRIKSVARFRKGKNNSLVPLPEKIMKIQDRGRGYLYVNFGMGCKHRKYIHRLVAEHFIPNPENKPEIDHINTDRTDNRVENLRWVTHKENMNNSLTIQKCKIAKGYEKIPFKVFDLELYRKKVG